MNANIPTLLLPLRIETRFIGNELRIRVFPDEPFTQNHERAITPAEQDDILSFKNAFADTRELAWQKLVKKYGVFRASYLVRLAESESKFATVKDLEYPTEKTFHFNWLPDRLKFFLYSKQGVLSPKMGAPITDQNALIAFGDGDEWLTSFDTAEGKGMAIRFDIPDHINTIDRIIVTGFRNSDGDIKEFKDLLDNYKYSKGFSLLEYGTPTNNFEKDRSKHTTRDRYEAEESYKYAVEGGTFTNDQKEIGEKLASALGLKTKDFEYVKNAAKVESPLFDNYQQATWFAMAGQSLKMMFGDALTDDDHQEIWEHFSEFVKTRGPLSAIKIGNQPYGVLPVTTFKSDAWEQPDPVLKKLYPVLKLLFHKWKEMAQDNTNIPRVHTHGGEVNKVDPYAEIFDVLNMQEHSVDFQLRVRKYDKISNRIPGWLGHEKNIPTPLPTLPLELLYKLLDGRPEVAGEIDFINNNRTTLGYLEPLLEQNTKSEYAYNLSFKDDVKINGEDQRIEYKVVEGEEETDETISLKLTEDENGLAVFKELLAELHKDVTGGQGELARKAVFNYQSEQPSIFIDLWLSGYAGAAQLYHRVIYFQPTIDQLKTYEHFKIKSPGGIQEDRLILTDGQQELTIHAPPGAKIVDWYVPKEKEEGEGDEEGGGEEEVVVAGQRLFLIRNSKELNKINALFYDLGQEMVQVLESLPVEESKIQQKKALLEAADLSSYRLDAWLTSLAARKLRNNRRIIMFKHKTFLGAYGWLENLQKDEENTVVQKDEENTEGPDLIDHSNKSDGGIIHCPTSGQSLVATLFKNSFLNHLNTAGEEQSPNPFTLNLTSDRVQKSNQLMEGIRQGQSVEALLGYQMERYLHEENLDHLIYELRKVFPLEVNIVNRGEENAQAVGFERMSVIDGLKIIEKKDDLSSYLSENIADSEAAILAGIKRLEDILDGSADVLYYEAGSQYMRANYARAAAAFDAAVGKVEPPEPDSIKTKVPGTGINHKLIMVFEKPGRTVQLSAKGYLEPALESWLNAHLGDRSQIGCKVELYEGADIYKQDAQLSPFKVVDVKLDELDLSYSDLLYLSEAPVSDGAGEIEIRIWNFVQAKETFTQESVTYKITAQAPDQCKSLSDALEWLKYALATLSRSRYLKSDDLTKAGESVSYDEAALKAIRERIRTLVKKIKEKKEDIAYLSNFDLQQAKHAFLTNEAVDEDKLQKEIDKKINQQLATVLKKFGKVEDDLSNNYYQAFEYLSQAAKILFGSSYLLLPPACASGTYVDRLAKYKAEQVIGLPAKGDDLNMVWGQERIQQWVEKLAQVAKGASAFEEWQMANTAWNSSTDWEYKVLQSHSHIHPHWVGLSIDEIDELRSRLNFAPLEGAYYPPSSESVVLFAPSSMAFQSNQIGEDTSTAVYGLVVEEFSEHIPDREMSTGLSFHYNGPNVESPQAFLLAVKNQMPQDDTPWTEDDLADILNDTMDLAKIRMMDLEALKEIGFALPMLDLTDIPSAN